MLSTQVLRDENSDVEFGSWTTTYISGEIWDLDSSPREEETEVQSVLGLGENTGMLGCLIILFLGCLCHDYIPWCCRWCPSWWYSLLKVRVRFRVSMTVRTSCSGPSSEAAITGGSGARNKYFSGFFRNWTETLLSLIYRNRGIGLGMVLHLLAHVVLSFSGCHDSSSSDGTKKDIRSQKPHSRVPSASHEIY